MSRLYLVFIYTISFPSALYSFSQSHAQDFNLDWLLLTITSVFVSTINVRLPKISSVISMGDVFIILSLLHFGPGPALVTYWLDILVAHLTDVLRKHGSQLRGKILLHRLFFNLGCCALCVGSMHVASGFVPEWTDGVPINLVAVLSVFAMTWFFVNTATVSLAISLWMGSTFWSVWKEGLHLYLLNFMGSAAAAGLITVFHSRVGSTVFFLAVPIVIVLFELYRFYISKYDQAQAHIDELSRLYLQTVESLAAAVDAKDRYTHGHIRRVQVYAVELARHLGITSDEQLMGMRAGALLHDIGKIAIPEYILNKPASLTESEYDRMKLHPLIGANMLRNIDFPYPVVPIVRSHHERWDGNGYPDGLKGEQIPLAARILSLVDCYDALTTNRPYRSPMPRAEIIKFFLRESGKAYDPKVVNTFINCLAAIEEAGASLPNAHQDVWALPEVLSHVSTNTRKLESVQPIKTYGKALIGDDKAQRQLRSLVSLARMDMSTLSRQDVLQLMGIRLTSLITFNAGVFYIADLQAGTVVAEHVIGENIDELRGLTLSLEHKLSGWAAANNQALCNLPCFPDFAANPETGAAYQLCAVAPMNHSGSVIGAISLYRRQSDKFADEDFRRLELVATQTAAAVSKCRDAAIRVSDGLFDVLTGLPNNDYLHLMFDQLVADANRFDYTVCLFAIKLSHKRSAVPDIPQESILVASNHLARQLCETDLLVRYSDHEFLAIIPRLSRSEAGRLRLRCQQDLRNRLTTAGVEVYVGFGLFPLDGGDLERLIAFAQWQGAETQQELNQQDSCGEGNTIPVAPLRDS